ncbi:MAG: hypothetical protein HQL39_01590 [Alphaproteobacteria bacterium]|nr:hypothetical protein [Alphaproteobacteria bacterium]
MPEAIVIDHLRAVNINACSGAHIIGFPGPATLSGFVHALERTHFRPQGRRHTGTIVVSHGFSLNLGRAKHPVTDPAAVAQGKMTASILDEKQANATASLVILLAAKAGEDDPAEIGAAMAEDLAAVLPGTRFAGGSIVSRPVVRWMMADTRLDLVTRALSALRGRVGQVLADRGELLGPTDEGDARDPLDRLLDALAAFPVVSEDETGARRRVGHARRENGWIVPVNVGLRLIEEPKRRDGVRHLDDGAVPRHAFAEDALSLAEWRSLRSILRRLRDGELEERIVWSPLRRKGRCFLAEGRVPA